MTQDTLLFAKVKPSAIIPSKLYEDAGYDFYACFEEDELLLLKGKPTLIPTGIATSMSPKYFLNMKHERGSTGKLGMSVLAGVVDSGYRGEIFINIVPTEFDVIISKKHNKPGLINDDILGIKVMVYPYKKAIAQATLEYVPNVEAKEITYEELKGIPSVRGDNRLGSSGK
jgi:dUTP pyrophosphatase